MNVHLTELQCGHMLAVNFNPATGSKAPGLIAWNDPAAPSEWVATSSNRAGNVVYPDAENVRQIVDAANIVLLIGPTGIISMELTDGISVFSFGRFLAAGVIRHRPWAEPQGLTVDEKASLRAEADEHRTEVAGLNAELDAVHAALGKAKPDGILLDPFRAFARELVAQPKAEHMADTIPVVSAGVRHLTWGHFRRLVQDDAA